MYFKIKLEPNHTLNNPWFNFHSVRIDHNWVTLISKRRQYYLYELGNFWFCRLKVNNWSINNFSTTCQLINWPCGLYDFLAILMSLKTLLSDFALYKKVIEERFTQRSKCDETKLPWIVKLKRNSSSIRRKFIVN